MNTNIFSKRNIGIVAGALIIIAAFLVLSNMNNSLKTPALIEEEETAALVEADQNIYEVSSNLRIVSIPYDYENVSEGETPINTSTIILENTADGTKVPLVTLKEKNKYLQVHKVNPTLKLVYYSIEPDGIGGYGVLIGSSNLHSVNYETLKIQDFFKSTPAFSYINFFDISSDGNLFTLWKFDNRMKKTELIVHNIRTGEEIVLPTDTKAGFTISGRTAFSPDNAHIVYSSMVSDPEAEKEQISVFTLATKKLNVVPPNFLTDKKTGEPKFADKIVWTDAEHFSVTGTNVDFACAVSEQVFSCQTKWPGVKK